MDPELDDWGMPIAPAQGGDVDDWGMPVADAAPAVEHQDAVVRPRETFTEEQAAQDRREGGRARGRITVLGETTITPTGESYDPSGEREAVLYQPAADAQAEAGVTVGDDDYRVRIPDAVRALAGGGAMPSLAGHVPQSYRPGALAAGWADTLTAGHTDELAALARAAGGEDYHAARADTRERQRLTDERGEGSYQAGQVAGIVPTLLVGSPAAALGVGRAGTTAGRIGAAALDAGAFGAAYGSGASEADFGTADYAQDVGEGAGTGLAVGGGLAGTGAAASGTARWLASKAGPGLIESAALRRITGLFNGDRPPRRIYREIAGPRAGRGDRVRRRIREYNELGIQSVDDAPDVAEAAGREMRTAAQEIDQLAGRPAGVREPPPFHVVSPQDMARRIRERATALRRDRGVGDDVVAGMEREAARWEEAARSGPMTMQRAWDFRREMSRPEYWTIGPRGEMNAAHAHRRDLYQIIREGMDAAAQRVSPDAAGRFREGARRYAIAEPLAEAGDEAALRAGQNSQFGLTSMITAGAGLQSGGVAGAVGAMAANRIRQRYQHRAVARTYETIAALAQRAPSTLGRFGEGLSRAMQRGGAAGFAAEHFRLSMSEPDYRATVRDVTDEESE